MELILNSENLSDRRFMFGRIGHKPFTDRFELQADGAITGYRHPNENAWSATEHRLVILNNLSEVFWIFDRAQVVDGRLKLHGKRANTPDAPYLVELLENRPITRAPAHLTVAAPMVPRGQACVAVLVRSYTCDEKFADLVRKLDTNRTHFDLYAVVNETEGRPTVSGVPVVWHSLQACRDLGITQETQAFFNVLGDIPLYFAFRELPSYSHYIMIEDDVDLVRDDASFVSRVAEILTADPGIDQVALQRAPIAPSDHYRYKAIARNFPPEQCFADYFPFLVLSRRAVSVLFSQRLLEAVRAPKPEDIMYCEHFVSSVLGAGGFRSVLLNELVPGSYSWPMMAMQVGDRAIGYPIGAPLTIPPGVEMVHPIYSHRGYVERVFRTLILGGRLEWDALGAELASERASVVPVDLKREVLARRQAVA